MRSRARRLAAIAGTTAILIVSACGDGGSEDRTERQTEPEGELVGGVIGSVAGRPGTDLRHGLVVAEGTVLIGRPIDVVLGAEDGDSWWEATTVIDGGEPLAIVDDYLDQARALGLTVQSESGCHLDGGVTSCGAHARTPDGAEPRSLQVIVLRGLRHDVVSDHVLVQHASGQAAQRLAPTAGLPPGEAIVPPPPSESFPSPAVAGEDLPTAGEVYLSLTVVDGSRLAGPPHLTLEDSTGGFEAILEVTGDPEQVLDGYLEQFEQAGFDVVDEVRGSEVGEASVRAVTASVAGGDHYRLDLHEHPDLPTLLHVYGSHD